MNKKQLMKNIYTVILLLLSLNASAQKDADNKITVTVSDTTGLLEKVKQAFIANDFIVKDTHNDTLITTYDKKVDIGYMYAKALVKGHVVTITGIYGLHRQDYFRNGLMPKAYKRCMYFKGSKTWPSLDGIASLIEGDAIYSKD